MIPILVAPNTLIELAQVPAELLQADVPRTIALDLYAPEAHPGPTLSASQADWVECSLNGGTTWTTLGTSPPSGLAVGAMSAGQRKALLFRVTVPVAIPPVRDRSVVLMVGGGTGS